jgi:predicted outer membrane repeat protein
MNPRQSSKLEVSAVHVICTCFLLIMSLSLSPARIQSATTMGSIRYVDVEASGANDGTSWVNAYTGLEPALEAALSDDQVWVAAGKYLPTAEHCGTGERYKSFQLKNGVAVYGGFDPSEGDTTWESRDWAGNTTILSGDIGSQGDNSDNSYHVFCHPQGLDLNSSAILDGFLIEDGNANSVYPDNVGGGMANEYSSPLLSHITIANNSAVGSGGGVWSLLSSPTLTDVTFDTNSARFGGGFYNYEGSPVLSNVTFSSNSATGETPMGGGMFDYGTASSAILTNIVFSNNSAYYGGGMFIQGSSPTLTYVNFDNNSARNGGGISTDGGSPVLINVTFVNNSATDGGGMYNSGSLAILLTNVTFSGNSAILDGGGIYNAGTSSASLMNVTFSGNTAGSGGGILNGGNALAILTNVTFFGNSALVYGGGILNGDFASASLTNVTFSGNAAADGGGIYSITPSILTNSILWGNQPNQIAGGAATVFYSDVQGGYDGVGNLNSDPLLCTLADNGGFVLTQALRIASPAIDAGDPDPTSCPATDARGQLRPFDGDGDGSPRCDLGAYEFTYLIEYLPMIMK